MPCCWQLTQTTNKDQLFVRSVFVVVWVNCQQQGVVGFLLAPVSLQTVSYNWSDIETYCMMGIVPVELHSVTKVVHHT